MIDHEFSRPDNVARPVSDLTSLRRVWTLTGHSRGDVIRGIVFRFAQSLSLGLSFAIVIWVITGLSTGRLLDDVWIRQIVALLAISLGGQLASGYFAVRYSWLSSFRIAADLRLSLLDNLRRLPTGFHLSKDTGDTVAALTSDVQMIESFLSDGLPRLVQAIGLPLAMLVFLAFQSPPIALAAGISIVTGLPVFVWSSRSLASLGILRQDLQAEAASRMIEYARGMPVIRSFNRVARGQESFQNALQAFRDISIHMVARLAAPLVAFGAIIILGVPTLMIASGALHSTGRLDTGTLLSTLVLTYSIYTPLLGLVAVMELVRLADASLTRIQRIMDAPTLTRSAEVDNVEGFAVRFEEVGFSYGGDTPALSGITFDVPERTMTAIVGPSGSGKTTLLNLLPRFFDVTAGAIKIGGVDIRDLAEERLAQLITVVFQDVYLFAGTIMDNIAFGQPEVRREEIERVAREAQAHDFIMALPLGYDTLVGEGGSTLSGGERQRISIARAMLKNAPIVLLDEATAAIDAITEKELQLALARLVAERTLIVVAHKLSTIMDADQIVVLDNGTIAEAGIHEDLLDMNGLYARIWGHRKIAENWTL